MTDKQGPDVKARIAALQAYDIMDTPPETSFDDLTSLASYICETPISLISLLDDKRQWFKSRVGLDATETPIEYAFCAHAIREDEILVVPDATQDDRFSSNPLVTNDPFIRFYAGAPLVSPEGVPLGTLCAIDRASHDLSQMQRQTLIVLARQVVIQLELRRAVRELSGALKEKQEALAEVRSLQEIIPICCYCKKVRDDEDFWHQVENYISSKSEIKFSHGICPECYPKAVRDMNPNFNEE